MQLRIAEVGDFLRTGARDLPSNAAWVWERARTQGARARSRAASWIASRTDGTAGSLEPDDMTKDELMDLARQENVRGRSSMTKAQLAAALRKVRG